LGGALIAKELVEKKLNKANRLERTS